MPRRSRSRRRQTSPPSSVSAPPSMPPWIFKSTLSFNGLLHFIVFVYLPVLCLTFMVLHQSSLSTVFSLATTASCLVSVLQWILSPPNRSIPSSFFDTPRVVFLTGSASGMSQRLTQSTGGAKPLSHPIITVIG